RLTCFAELVFRNLPVYRFAGYAVPSVKCEVFIGLEGELCHQLGSTRGGVYVVAEPGPGECIGIRVQCPGSPHTAFQPKVKTLFPGRVGGFPKRSGVHRLKTGPIMSPGSCQGESACRTEQDALDERPTPACRT